MLGARRAGRTALLVLMPSDVRAPVSGDTVLKLRNWSSLWADLMHVDMVLHARDNTPDVATNLFARRALWEGAVIAYGRAAKTGSRQILVTELLSALGPHAQQCHDEVIRWRDKHVAHRQDRSRERVTAEAVLDPAGKRILEIEIAVAPAVGPDYDGGQLVPRFQTLVFDLRNLAWEQRIAPLEAQAIAENSPQVDRLLQAARRHTPPPPTPFQINIRPTH